MFKLTNTMQTSKSALCLEMKWKKEKPPVACAGSIVLVGGTFGGDVFAAPTEKPIPGLLLNAQAVRAEIVGPVVEEWPHWVTLLLDMSVGLLIALIFSRRLHRWIVRLLQPRPAAQERWRRRADHVMWRVGATVGLGLIVYVISWALFSSKEILWLSWVGMLLMGLAWHIAFAETRHMRMKVEH